MTGLGVPATLFLILAACQLDADETGPTGTIPTDTSTVTDTDPPATPVHTLRFADIGLPQTEEERRIVRGTTVATANGVDVPVDFQVLLRSGDSPDGDAVFGRLVSASGEPVLKRDGTEDVSSSLDFSSLQRTDAGAVVSITHVESNPGALYRTALSEDITTGGLRATHTAPVDLASIGGLYLPCAASITPWGTHLGGEEYPPDARSWEQAAAWDDVPLNIRAFVRYWGHDVFTDADEDGEPDNTDLAALRADFQPYRYGFPFEVSVGDGGTDVVRHTAMGRTSVELALVMPDQRTAYITDDETNAGLYLFIADVAGDLSAGTLYAMVWEQTDDAGAGQADLSWRSLGHATDTEIDQHIADGVVFSDLFTTAMSLQGPDGRPTWECPDGFTSVNTGAGFECLAVVPGRETAASRLETDRYAALLGATTELHKGEGITHDPDRGRLYLSISEINQGMESDALGGYDLGGPDDIRLAPNACGAVYALDLGPSADLDSDHVAHHASALLTGTPTVYDDESPYAGNGCAVDGIANPDNLHYWPAFQLLVVGEDSRKQVNDSVWVHDLREGTLDRVLTAPYGAENTSIQAIDLGAGWQYLKVVIHGPFDERSLPGAETPEELQAQDGFLGPIPTAVDE